MRVLFIGLDGATWNLLKPWIKEGKLPVFRTLMENGCFGILRSVIPPLTAATWTTIATGKNPGKTGMFDFIDRYGNITTSNNIRAERIWNILSKYGYKSCVINYPFTYPLDKINGCVVADFMTPPNRRDVVYPKSYRKFLKKVRYKLGIEYEKTKLNIKERKKRAEEKKLLLSSIYDVVEKRFELAKELVKVERWDLFILIIKESDEMQHFFWNSKKILLEFFQMIDQNIGNLLNEFKRYQGEFVTFLISDHGFGPTSKKSFNLYPIMKKLGVDIPITLRLGEIMDIPFFSKVAKLILTNLFIRDIFMSEYNKFGVRAFGIYLKDKSIAKKLVSILSSFRDKNGKKIFKVVKLAEDYYSGPYVSEGPDIIYITDPEYRVVFVPSKMIIKESYTVLPGDHMSHLDGIFVISGNNVQRNLTTLNATDIAPMILNIFNIPIPKDMDGKLYEILIKNEK